MDMVDLNSYLIIWDTVVNCILDRLLTVTGTTNTVVCRVVTVTEDTEVLLLLTTLLITTEGTVAALLVCLYLPLDPVLNRSTKSLICRRVVPRV